METLLVKIFADGTCVEPSNKAFRGINFADLLTAYREFCKSEQMPTPAVDLGEVIDFYNKALNR